MNDFQFGLWDCTKRFSNDAEYASIMKLVSRPTIPAVTSDAATVCHPPRPLDHPVQHAALPRVEVSMFYPNPEEQYLATSLRVARK
mmetsp:Transcript_169/g.371  ORF Transcript_169/g.371 Transcript_169/m.371 type:complete len:86 (+) Transcript_169:1766-2023(+)